MKKLLVLLLLAGIITYVSNINEYVEIPSTSIRMRVIANSDKKEDQENKQIIKSALEKKIYEIIKNDNNTEDVENSLVMNKENIDNEISKTINENNMNISFTSNYGINYFPSKEFKGLTYKSGNYKSFVVTLGEGNGENWWCVMYPPLCLVDEKKNAYEYHYLIKDIINQYN